MNIVKRTKGFFFLILALVTVLSLLVPTAVFADEDEWPQFQNDAANTGVSSSEAPDTASLKWVSDAIGANPSSSVAVADGKVFAICETGVYCLDQSDGHTIWSHSITGSGVWGSWAGPAYHDGNVFMATDGIYCLDANDGHEVWAYPYPSGLSACDGCVTVADGKVIAGDWDGHHYYCVSEADGSYLWTYTVAGYSQGTPAYHDGKFFLTSWEYIGGHVYCVNAAAGSLVWHSAGKTDGTYNYDCCGSVCVAAGKVFFTTYNFNDDGELMALNESDGSVAWGPVLIKRTDSTPAYLDGKLYVCGGCAGYSDASTYCIDASNGNIIWETPTLGNWTCSVAVADGKVFVGKAGDFFDYGGIYALDITNGNEIWHYDHGGASASVAGGVVYTVGEGKVWAFGEPDTPPWDLNGDGNIDIFDMLLVANHLGETGAPGWITEDFNSDGVIDIFDMLLVANHLGE